MFPFVLVTTFLISLKTEQSCQNRSLLGGCLDLNEDIDVEEVSSRKVHYFWLYQTNYGISVLSVIEVVSILNAIVICKRVDV